MRRRSFLIGLGGAAALWPLAARGQQAVMPVIGFLGAPSAAPYARYVDAIHQGLKQAGFVEGQNVRTEYRWAEGHYDRLPALAADLVSRHVSVIVPIGGTPAVAAAKTATSTTPIVFNIGSDPVKLRLAKPGVKMFDANANAHGLLRSSQHAATGGNANGGGAPTVVQ